MLGRDTEVTQGRLLEAAIVRRIRQRRPSGHYHVVWVRPDSAHRSSEMSYRDALDELRGQEDITRRLGHRVRRVASLILRYTTENGFKGSFFVEPCDRPSPCNSEIGDMIRFVREATNPGGYEQRPLC